MVLHYVCKRCGVITKRVGGKDCVDCESIGTLIEVNFLRGDEKCFQLQVKC